MKVRAKKVYACDESSCKKVLKTFESSCKKVYLCNR